MNCRLISIMNICLIGPFPRPVGGVSVHLDRLKQLISSECRVYLVDESPIKKKGIINLRKLQFFYYFLYLIKSDVVHIHSSITILRLFHICMSLFFGKRTIVTIHSFRASSINKLEKILFSKCYKVLIVRSSYSNKIGLNNVLHMPAFLPPINSP